MILTYQGMARLLNSFDNFNTVIENVLSGFFATNSYITYETFIKYMGVNVNRMRERIDDAVFDFKKTDNIGVFFETFDSYPVDASISYPESEEVKKKKLYI